jgi:hypothetical protein
MITGTLKIGTTGNSQSQSIWLSLAKHPRVYKYIFMISGLTLAHPGISIVKINLVHARIEEGCGAHRTLIFSFL